MPRPRSLRARVAALVPLLVVAVPAQQPAGPAARSRLEQRVYEALNCKEPVLRAAAARYLGRFGDASHVGWLHERVGDFDERVRQDVVGALARLAHVSSRPFLTETLERDASYRVRHSALGGLRQIAQAHGPFVSDEARAIADLVMKDEDERMQVSGWKHLAGLADIDLSEATFDLLERYSENAWARRAVLLGLAVVRNADRATELRALLAESLSNIEKHHVAQRLVELASATQSDRDHLLPGYIESSQYSQESWNVWRRFGTAGWREVEPSMALAALAQARLVCVGEMHRPRVLQDVQRRIVHELDSAWSGGRFLGFENIEWQRSVVEFAEGLGWTTVPLERVDKNWPLEVSRFHERDAEMLRSIDAWAKAHPEGRMLIVYGEDHVGHILDRHPIPAMTVWSLSPPHGLLRALGEDPDPADRVFHPVGRDDLFYWPSRGWFVDSAEDERLYGYLK